MKVRIPRPISELRAAPRNAREVFFEIRRLVLHDKKLLLWCAFLFLFPVYFWGSGLPQPSELLLLALLPLLIASRKPGEGRLPPLLRRPIVLLSIFVGYVILSNFLWSFALFTFKLSAKKGFVLSPSYYIFNALLFWTFLLMYRRYGLTLIWLTVYVTLFTVMFQTGASFVTSGHGDRSSMFFNNPNQLGYYGLLCACILLLGQRKLRLSSVTMTIGLMAAAYLTLISASKAALASIAALTIVFVLNRVRTMVLAGLVLAILVSTENPFSQALENAQARIDRDNNEQQLSLAEQRGYDRILNNPEYWLFGSGEGDYQRFGETTAIGSHELHSSMGTLFFCYGTVGTLLFLVFAFNVVRGNGLRPYLVMGPAFAYGMAHQGLRFALFWVLLGMVVALRHADRTRGPPRAQVVRA